MTPSSDNIYSGPAVAHTKRPSRYDKCQCGAIKQRFSELCKICRNKQFLRPQVIQPTDAPYRLIPLTRGLTAMVSTHRYEEINAFLWYAVGKGRWIYAMRSVRLPSKKRQWISMHRQIMGVGPDDPIEIDHVEPTQTLNNTDENLRFATRGDQAHNQTRSKANTSGYKGVSPDKYPGKWRASISVNGKLKNLGTFPTKQSAHDAYRAAARAAFGEFARFE